MPHPQKEKIKQNENLLYEFFHVHSKLFKPITNNIKLLYFKIYR